MRLCDVYFLLGIIIRFYFYTSRGIYGRQKDQPRKKRQGAA
jgi:hypothetical protein